jgi:hypothetical protein
MDPLDPLQILSLTPNNFSHYPEHLGRPKSASLHPRTQRKTRDRAHHMLLQVVRRRKEFSLLPRKKSPLLQERLVDRNSSSLPHPPAPRKTRNRAQHVLLPVAGRCHGVVLLGVFATRMQQVQAFDSRTPACGRLFSEQASVGCTLVASLLLRELRCAGTRASSLFFPAVFRQLGPSPSTPFGPPENHQISESMPDPTQQTHTHGHGFARRKDACLPRVSGSITWSFERRCVDWHGGERCTPMVSER